MTSAVTGAVVVSGRFLNGPLGLSLALSGLAVAIHGSGGYFVDSAANTLRLFR